MVSKRIEMLEVVRRLPGSKYECRCDCGNSRVVNVGHFNTGKIKSCGCHIARHGHGGSGKKTRTYTSYHNMIARCHKPTNKRYKDYGAKGIKVCKRWRDDFRNFLADMGECPDGLTIDRIDNGLGYYPENCRWVSRSANQRNRDNSIIWVVCGTQYQTAKAAARDYGVSTNTISAWCKGRVAEGRYYPPRMGCRAFRKYDNKPVAIRETQMRLIEKGLM